MSFTLWYHPYAGYGQKAAVAAYELGMPFDLRVVDHADAALMAEFARISPFGKMPVLVDGEGRVFNESSIVIEWMDRNAGGGRLIPADPDAALETRLIDRIVDTYVGGPMNRLVFNRLGRAGTPNPVAMEQDSAELVRAWDVLDVALAEAGLEPGMLDRRVGELSGGEAVLTAIAGTRLVTRRRPPKR